MSVYYPVDRTPENSRYLSHSQSSWLRKQDKTLLGMARASVPYGREDHPSVRWFRWLKRVKMGTIERVGEVASVFRPEMEGFQQMCKRRMVPVIFSHGLSSNRSMHSVICRDIASQGFIVFAPDHMDLSSSFYENSEGEGYWYSNKYDSHDLQFRTG